MGLVYTENIDVFSKAEVDSSLESEFYVEYLPTSSLKNSSDFISFDILGDGSKMVNLSKTQIKITCKITQTDGSSIALPEDNITTVNLTLHSLIKQIDISLNGVNPAQSVGSHYSYKALLDFLLEKPKDYLESHATGAGFFLDDVRFRTAGAVDAALNEGGFKRNAMFVNSQLCELIGNLQGADLAAVNRLILNGVQVQIKIYQHSDNFRLLNGNPNVHKYKLDIEAAKLLVCFVEVKPHVTLSIEKMLNTTPAVYPFLKSDLRSYTVSSGSSVFEIDGILPVVPASLCLVLIDQAAYAGDETLNPYYFEGEPITALTVCIAGREFCPKYTGLNFTTSGFLEPFNNLPKTAVSIDRFSYKSGYTIFFYDINPTVTELGLHQKNKPGNTRIYVQFSPATTKVYSLLVYAKYSSQFQIDKSRLVTFTS